MKNTYSRWSIIIISIVLIIFRILYLNHADNERPNPLTWDALGYYIYLPATFIYEDATDLKWFPTIEKKYHLIGNGDFYQAHQQENEQYVFKYFGGVAIMQSPFFLIAHWTAMNTDYPADGFSLPYQYGVLFGAVFYAILGLLFLRVVLLKYFDDKTVGITLLLTFLATNFIQYTAVDGALSHAFIFPLYALLLLFTQKWHEKPNVLWAALTGLVIGIATICRPTEAIMVLIPIFWGMHDKETAKLKWDLVKKHKKHIYAAAILGIMGILPQLIYWKIATGGFVYNVGSKWSFLSPFFRVLFGWEKGWFIYTPIAFFFMAGFFFMKKFPFKKAVITYGLLNIYIVISWFIWRYGASYSTRALVQSYPVYALAFAAFIQYIRGTKWRIGFYGLGIYLLTLNFFQLWQYNKNILHYDDMNRKYYSQIYWNPTPDALDFSLLDTPDWIRNEAKFQKKTIVKAEDSENIHVVANGNMVLKEISIPQSGDEKERWLKVECNILCEKGLWQSYLKGSLADKNTRIRLYNAMTQKGEFTKYAFYFKLPENLKQETFQLSIDANAEFVGKIEKLSIDYLF